MRHIIISKSAKGFIVEQELTKFIFFKKRVPFVKYNGAYHCFPYSKLENCIKDLFNNYLEYGERIKLTIYDYEYE